MKLKQSGQFRKIEAAVLYVTNDCNLHCDYCFLRNNGYINKQKLNLKKGQEILDFLISNSKKRLKLAFFGGEPLIEHRLIFDLINYGNRLAADNGIKIDYGITTNCVFLSQQIIDFFHENGVQILTSIDGDKERIINVKGEKAYDSIHKNIKLLIKKGIPVTARATLDPLDIDLVRFTNYFVAEGFSYISFIPDDNAKWNMELVDLEEKKLIDLFIKKALGGQIIYLKQEMKIIEYLTGISKLDDSKPICGAGESFIGITVNGEIMPCHHPEVWYPEWIMGNATNGVIDFEKSNPIRKIMKKNIPECKDCDSKDVCAGLCAVVNKRINGDMNVPANNFCMWTKARKKYLSEALNVLVYEKKNIHFLEYLFDLFTFSTIYKSISGERTLIDLSLPIHLEVLEEHVVLSSIFFRSNNDISSLKGKKILTPLPQCAVLEFKGKVEFNSYTELTAKYKIDSLSKLLENHKFKPIFKLYVERFIEHKCRDCLHYIRNNCAYIKEFKNSCS